MLIDDLKAVDALLSDESKWTPAAYAMDGTGNWTQSFSQTAVRWSLRGAVQRVTAHGQTGQFVVVLNYLRRYTEKHPSTFPATKALLKRVINDLS